MCCLSTLYVYVCTAFVDFNSCGQSTDGWFCKCCKKLTTGIENSGQFCLVFKNETELIFGFLHTASLMPYMFVYVSAAVS